MDKLISKYIIAAILGVSVFYLLTAILIGTAQGNTGNDYRISEFRKQIFDAQTNAADAHESLEKAKYVTKAAVEAERKAQAIADGYSNTATAARKAICEISKEACTNANLDPAGAGTNLQEFFQLAR